MVLADAPSEHKPIAGESTVVFRDRSGMSPDEEAVTGALEGCKGKEACIQAALEERYLGGPEKDNPGQGAEAPAHR